MQTEPKYQISKHTIGNGAFILFKGENSGDGLQDTEVNIGDTLVCCISWNDKDAFLKELTEVVDKYAI